MYLTAHFRKFDWVLFGACLGLTVFGLVAIYGTSLAGATPSLTVFWKQLIFAGLGVTLSVVISFFNYRLLSGAAKALYIFAVALLISVLVFGSTMRGTRGWFGIGIFGIQPVELVKIILIIFLAKFMSDYARDPLGLKRIIKSGAALSAIFGLVLLQPDFGSALLLMAVWGALLLIAGIRRNHLLIIAGLGLATAVATWFFFLGTYQRQRIEVFLDPSLDPQGSGYNVIQSSIAIGSGGLFGKGLGFGSQSQLRFLPERQTDFISAVIAEELGFVGVLVLLGLFGVVFWRLYSLAVTSRSDFAMFLILGVAISLAVELSVNLGGAMQLLPMTGVTLPFVSYGGSSLLAKFIMLGIMQSVAVRRS
jgi:rod shape determining protein RodA